MRPEVLARPSGKGRRYRSVGPIQHISAAPSFVAARCEVETGPFWRRRCSTRRRLRFGYRNEDASRERHEDSVHAEFAPDVCEVRHVLGVVEKERPKRV